ncbi:hypothetical protein TNCV_3852471 [Trichonephila clavipes]|nr:hypothetical protein TNCV_3852471 [Trichonephila clavipes]
MMYLWVQCILPGVGTRHPFRWGKRRTQHIPFVVNNNRADIKITVAIPRDRRPPITPPLFQINKTRMNEKQKFQIQLSPHQKKCWASDPEEKKFRKIKLSPHRKKMLGITDPMRSNFAMMREMSNRKRFDSGQGGASVETGPKSINPPHHVGMP